LYHFPISYKPNIINKIKTKGNNTKNHDKAVRPILHNHDKIKVYTSAKSKLLSMAITWKPLNKLKKILRIDKAKYNFAGVQIFSNSFDENIIIYINIFILFLVIYNFL